MAGDFVSQLDTYALTTLVKANKELGLTSDGGDEDNHIEGLINQASKTIENALNRKFLARLYVKERYDGKEQEILYFKQYPVLAVNLDDLVWDAATKKVTRDDGGSFVDDGFTAGDKVLVQNSDENSGLLTIATAGVAALVLTFDDTIVADTDDDDVTISHFRGLWINEEEIDSEYYLVDIDNIYYLSGFSEGHKNIRITYYAGYATVPSDVEECCLRVIKKIYDKDRNVKSESLGPHSITYFEDGDITDDIRKELSSYINWTV